jgi:hypothetical protein
VIPNSSDRALLIVERVSADQQTRIGVWRGDFFGIGDDIWVLRIRPLLDEIVLDRGSAAVRQIDAVAGGAVPIDEPVVRQDVDGSPAFQLMTDIRLMKLPVGNGQTGNLTDIDIVGVTVARAIESELAVIDGDRRPGNGVS